MSDFTRKNRASGGSIWAKMKTGRPGSALAGEQ